MKLKDNTIKTGRRKYFR